MREVVNERARRRARQQDPRYACAVRHVARELGNVISVHRLQVKHVRALPSVVLVAEVWNQSTSVVARDVLARMRALRSESSP